MKVVKSVAVGTKTRPGGTMAVAATVDWEPVNKFWIVVAQPLSLLKFSSAAST